MNLDLTRVFVKVVQSGSFSKAAAILRLPKSTVSKAVAKLEREAGVQLLVRTTRSLALTLEGRGFYDTCAQAIQIVEDAQKMIQGRDRLSGLLRITAPEDLGAYVVAPAIAKLAIQYPQLSFEVYCTDDLVNLVQEHFDLAVRIGPITESSFKIRRAGEIQLIAVASPLYLKSKPKVKHPRDLEAMDCLGFNDAVFKKWAFRSERETVHVPVKTRIYSNLMSSLVKMALAHAGVAWVPRFICQGELASGQLLRILPEWQGVEMPVSVISPLSSANSVRLKTVAEEIWTTLRTTLG